VSQGKSQSTPGGGEKSDSAPKRSLKRKRPRPAFFALLLLVVIAGGYYTLYFLRHGEDLRDYYLRRLLVSADNAEQEIGRLWHNVDRTLKNLDKNARIQDKIALIPVFESDEGKACDNLRKDLDKDTGPDTAGARDDVTQAEEVEPNKGKAGGDGAETEKDLTNNPKDSFTTVAGFDGADAILCFIGHGSLPADLSPPAKLATLLESKLPIEDFDSVVLARGDGEVLLMLQHQNTVIDIVQLDILQAQADGEQKSDTKVEPVAGISQEHTSIGKFTIADTTYLAFVQPVHIPIDLAWSTTTDDDREKTWFLVGLKEEGRFRAEAMAIPKHPTPGSPGHRAYRLAG
jgi:hypothetical protein